MPDDRLTLKFATRPRPARAGALERLAPELGRSPGLGDARLRQPRAGDRPLRAARHLPARARRDHGAGLPGVRHRRARGRRGGGAGAAGRAHRHLRRHAARARARRGRSPTRRPRAAGRRRLRRRQALELARATDGGGGLLRHRLRDHGGGHGGGAARDCRRTSRSSRRTSTSRR